MQSHSHSVTASHKQIGHRTFIGGVFLWHLFDRKILRTVCALRHNEKRNPTRSRGTALQNRTRLIVLILSSGTRRLLFGFRFFFLHFCLSFSLQPSGSLSIEWTQQRMHRWWRRQRWRQQQSIADKRLFTQLSSLPDTHTRTHRHAARSASAVRLDQLDMEN